jgi:hypothetical protein
MAMAGVRGIEGAAEQANTAAPAVPLRRYQGRTWPLPVTR